MTIYGLHAGDQAAVFTGILTGVILGVVFLVVAVLFPRLVLTEKNITLRNIGYRLDTEWSNVAGLRRARAAEGLLLNRPMTCKGAGRFAYSASSAQFFFGYFPPEVLEQIRAGCYIPLDAFSYWLKHGDLERQILRHAPELAEAGTAPASSDGRKTP